MKHPNSSNVHHNISNENPVRSTKIYKIKIILKCIDKINYYENAFGSREGNW